ncbi:hypothetical protein DID88_008123 [Monilinia fructigena]|uniref:Uncharacterized protein n=1 Tax=Monilinia fructigena TaxID=38457 RepID=A0A395J5E3_9HELO|nr:hypothetical protein DID88_008123 [Monilinia fructigena]
MRGLHRFLLCPALLVVATNISPESAFPSINSTSFDAGDYGAYPNRTYRTRADIISPRLNILQADPQCDDGLYTMISLRGDRVHITGQSPMIHDARGNLVWMNASYGETFGLNMQRYKGVDYLTFWQGDDSVGGHGEGAYILLDSQYKEAFRISAGDGHPGDLHEFHITPSGTALVTQYILKEAPIIYRQRSRKGWIWDSVIQEINIETNEILFEWHASDHYGTEESYLPPGTMGLRKDHAYDFFHVNSIDKDGVEVVREYVNPRKIISASQGNMQVLENGNVVVGYGYNAAWTEYSAEGKVLCDVHIGSQKAFNTGAVQTYKVLKHAWTGKPDSVPDVKVVKNKVYVSWNGATEVKRWILEGSRSERGKIGKEGFQVVFEVEKTGFETKILFHKRAWCWVRVVAVDGEGVRLRNSEIWTTGTDCEDTIDPSDTGETIEEEPEDENLLLPSKFAFQLIVLAGFAIGGLELCRRQFLKRTFSGVAYRVLPLQNQG